MTNKKVVIGLTILGVAAIATYAIVGSPGRQENTGGSIGMAKKYRAEQINEADVSLQDPEVQELIQSDTFYQLITDATFRRSVTKEFEKMNVAMAGLNRALVATTEEGAKQAVASPTDAIFRAGDRLQKQDVKDALLKGDKVTMADVANRNGISQEDMDALRTSIAGLNPDGQKTALDVYGDLARVKIKNPGTFGRTEIQGAVSRIGEHLDKQDVQTALLKGDPVMMADVANRHGIKAADLTTLRQGITSLDAEGQKQAIQGLSRLQQIGGLGKSGVADAVARTGHVLGKQDVQTALLKGDPVMMADVANRHGIKAADLTTLRQGIASLDAEGQKQAIQGLSRLDQMGALGKSGVADAVARNGDKLQKQDVQDALLKGDPVMMADVANKNGIKAEDMTTMRQGLASATPEAQKQAIAQWSEFGRVNIKHMELFGHGVTQDGMSRGGIPKHAEISREFFTSVDVLSRGGALNNPKVRDGLARNDVAEAQKNAPAANIKDLEVVARVIKHSDPGFQAAFVQNGLGKLGQHVADVHFQDVMGTAAFGKTLDLNGLILRSAIAGVESNGRSYLADMNRIKVQS